MKGIACLGLVLSVVALGGCAGEPAAAPNDGSGEGSNAAGEATDDARSAAAGEEGTMWTVLFDGGSLDAWRGYRMDSLPAGWRVDDGAIHFMPPAEGAAAGERADLVTDATFGDFELRFEWAVSPGGNSGVFFRVSEDREQTYHTGPEYQLLDNSGHRDGQSPLTSAGSNFALHAPARDATRPVGDFNEGRIVVDGARIEHWMNGDKLLEYTLWSDEWEALIAGSKFGAMPGYGRNESGHIALQDHGDEVWFRNIRVRRLGEQP